MPIDLIQIEIFLIDNNNNHIYVGDLISDSKNIFDDNDTIQPAFKPYIILEKGSLKFGIIGLASAAPEKIKGIHVGNPINYYKKYRP